MKQPFVNMEEKMNKVVGRRLKSPEPFAAGMKMQFRAVELHKTCKPRWAPVGVYRFNSHEEADAWMLKMLARSQTPEN